MSKWSKADIDYLVKFHKKYSEVGKPKTAVKMEGVRYCPECAGPLFQDPKSTKYCFRCGQRVKWI